MDSDEDFSGPKQNTVSNCFDSGNCADGKVADHDHMESNLIGDLESVDLNDSSNDCSERNSPNMTDAISAGMTDTANVSMTDSPTSITSGGQTSKKKK